MVLILQSEDPRHTDLKWLI